MNFLGFHIGRRTPAHHPAPPRFYAATKAEQRKAHTVAEARRKELEALSASFTDEAARKALIERALTVQLGDKQQGRASQ